MATVEKKSQKKDKFQTWSHMKTKNTIAGYLCRKEKNILSLASDHASFLRGYGEKNATTPAFCPLITLWFWLTTYLKQVYMQGRPLFSLSFGQSVGFFSSLLQIMVAPERRCAAFDKSCDSINWEEIFPTKFVCLLLLIGPHWGGPPRLENCSVYERNINVWMKWWEDEWGSE